MKTRMLLVGVMHAYIKLYHMKSFVWMCRIVMEKRNGFTGHNSEPTSSMRRERACKVNECRLAPIHFYFIIRFAFLRLINDSPANLFRNGPIWLQFKYVYVVSYTQEFLLPILRQIIFPLPCFISLFIPFRKNVNSI